MTGDVLGVDCTTDERGQRRIVGLPTRPSENETVMRGKLAFTVWV